MMSKSGPSGFTLAKQVALYEQHLNKSYCDVVIKIREEEFFIHSCIVAAACPKLNKLIDENKVIVDVKDRPSVEVELKEEALSEEIFEFLLSYIYLGCIDWTKVNSESMKKLLDAAEWCELDQLVKDYMTMNEEDSANSTIVMVDTCGELESPDPVNSDNLAAFYTNAAQNQDILFCMFCGEEFDTDDGMILIEHIKSHKGEQPSDLPEKTSYRQRRKASLGVKQKYKSLIPTSSKREKANEEVFDSDDEPLTKHTKPTYIPMFKKDFLCHICNKKLATQKSLDNHLKRHCVAKEKADQPEESSQSDELSNDFVLELSTDASGQHAKSTKGIVVRTGRYVRPYVKKTNGQHSNGNQPPQRRKQKMTKLWMCPQCPQFVFERKRDQLIHIRAEHGVIKRYVCEHCGKELDGKTALTLHMRMHTGERPFVCPVCSRGFSERKTMEDHTRRHTGERPFLCPECGKNFTFRQSLYRHLKFHSGKRPYQCKICGKAFVLKQNLHEHVARHEKHKLIPCVDCMEKFAGQEMLMRHREEVHLEVSNIVEEVRIIDMTNEEKNLDTGANYEVTIDAGVLQSFQE